MMCKHSRLVSRKNWTRVALSSAVALNALVWAMTCLAFEGGMELKNSHWDPVVHLESEAGTCSGTLIDEMHILTAAHCVNAIGQELTVYARFDAQFNIGSAKVVYIDPRYTDQSYKNDVAIIELNVPHEQTVFQVMSSVEYLRVLQIKHTLPSTALVAGYGLTASQSTGVRRGGQIRRVGFDDTLDILVGRHSSLNGASRPGDSGGPLLSIFEDYPIIAGVVSGKNVWRRIRFDGSEKEDQILRFSPVVPSLCRMSKALQRQIGFDATKCDAISSLLSKRKSIVETTEGKLWLAFLLKRSAISDIPEYGNIILELLTQAYAEGADSMLFYWTHKGFPLALEFLGESEYAHLAERMKVQMVRYFGERFEQDNGSPYSVIREILNENKGLVRERERILFAAYKRSSLRGDECSPIPCEQYLRGLRGARSRSSVSWDDYLSELQSNSRTATWADLQPVVCSIASWVDGATRYPEAVDSMDVDELNVTVKSRFESTSEKHFGVKGEAGAVGAYLTFEGTRLIISFSFKGNEQVLESSRFLQAFSDVGYQIKKVDEWFEGIRGTWDSIKFKNTTGSYIRNNGDGTFEEIRNTEFRFYLDTNSESGVFVELNVLSRILECD